MVEDSTKMVMDCLVRIPRDVLRKFHLPSLDLPLLALADGLPVAGCSLSSRLRFHPLRAQSRRCRACFQSWGFSLCLARLKACLTSGRVAVTTALLHGLGASPGQLLQDFLINMCQGRQFPMNPPRSGVHLLPYTWRVPESHGDNDVIMVTPNLVPTIRLDGNQVPPGIHANAHVNLSRSSPVPRAAGGLSVLFWARLFSNPWSCRLHRAAPVLDPAPIEGAH